MTIQWKCHETIGRVTLNVNREGQEPHFLKFQVVEGNCKPSLSAEACENYSKLIVNQHHKSTV